MAIASGIWYGVDRASGPARPPASKQESSGAGEDVGAEGGEAEQCPAHRVQPNRGDGADEHRPGDWQIENRGRGSRNHRDHERLEPPVGGDHHSAEERGHVAHQAEPAQGDRLVGVDASQSEQQGSHPEQGDAIGQGVRRRRHPFWSEQPYAPQAHDLAQDDQDRSGEAEHACTATER
jgi:hypothetical protein